VTGDVGIFWIYRGQLIKAAVPLVDGNDDGLFVNGPDDHDSESVKNPRDQQNIPLEKSSRERAESLLYLSTIEHSPTAHGLSHDNVIPGPTPAPRGRGYEAAEMCSAAARALCTGIPVVESGAFRHGQGQEGGCLHECHETVTPTRGVGWPRICHRV
jgi:hypothetical protein